MYTLVRTVGVAGGVPFSQIEGVYATREAAEAMITILRETVENPNRINMSYKVVADGEATV